MSDAQRAKYCLLFGGVLWGLYWMPMKQIEATGLSGIAPSLGVFSLAFIAIVPLIIWRWRLLRSRFGDLAVAGLFGGGALGLFTIALAETEIVRAILLFYLSPVWSTALGIVFLGDRPTLARISTLVLGLIGLVIVLGVEGGVPMPRNAGDGYALASGVCWSLASLKLYRMKSVPIPDLIVALTTGCIIVTVGLFALSDDVFPREIFPVAAPWMLFAGLYIVPTLTMTLWPTTVLLPAQAGLLLMTEVVVGTVSAALLSGEPFGTREALGCVLITGALLAEVLIPSRRPVSPEDHAGL